MYCIKFTDEVIYNEVVSIGASFPNRIETDNLFEEPNWLSYSRFDMYYVIEEKDSGREFEYLVT